MIVRSGSIRCNRSALESPAPADDEFVDCRRGGNRCLRP